MKKILVITYYWPPASGPGVQRWLKFTKYLSQMDWEVHILTMKGGTYLSHDPSLESDIPHAIQVHKSLSIEPHHFYNLFRGKRITELEQGIESIKEPKGWLSKLANQVRSRYFIPDGRIWWIPLTYRKALKIIKSNQIDIIVTTGPPHSTHLTGMKIKKRTGLPWLVDMRDPWTNVYYNKYLKRSSRSEQKDKRYEQEVLSTADAVAVVSPGMSRYTKAFNPNTFELWNGFDQDDDQIVDLSKTETFTMQYIGTFKPSQMNSHWIEAILELNQEVPGFKESFGIVFIGNVSADLKNTLVTKLDKQIRFEPFVAHSEAIVKMKTANMLLWIIPSGITAKSILTGKIFEYLASQTPLLSIGPTDGDAAFLLRQVNRPAMIDYYNKSAIKDRIIEQFAYWKDHNGLSMKYNDAENMIFERRKLAQQLSAKLVELI